eukprot:3887979-Rhodomonas_salina.1
MRGGVEVYFSNSDPNQEVFVYREGWTSIEPSVGSAAGGETVTIHGFGFDVTAGSALYHCIWSNDTLVRDGPLGSNVHYSPALVVESSSRITCTSPFWTLPSGVHNVGVT